MGSSPSKENTQTYQVWETGVAGIEGDNGEWIVTKWSKTRPPPLISDSCVISAPMGFMKMTGVTKVANTTNTTKVTYAEDVINIDESTDELQFVLEYSVQNSSA